MTPNEWVQLNLRLDEQFRHIHARLDTLQNALHAMQCSTQERLNAHEQYHLANEQHWGPERLAQRHPFRTALLAAVLLAFLAFSRPDAPELLRRALLYFLGH